MKTTNHFDERGNYVNVENLTLKQIYERGFDEGFKKGYIEGALHKDSDISKMTDDLYNKLMGGGV